MSFELPEEYDKYRKSAHGHYGDRCNGFIFLKQKGLAIQFSDGLGWEHVSVSRRSKVPTYEDMCWVKDLFWDPEDCVMQLHVPAEEHINAHPYCLHLWRPMHEEIPRPPARAVA